MKRDVDFDAPELLAFLRQDMDGPAQLFPGELIFEEIAALAEAIDLHDFQLQQLSAREVHEASRRTVQDARAAGAFIAPTAAALSQPVQERLLP